MTELSTENMQGETRTTFDTVILSSLLKMGFITQVTSPNDRQPEYAITPTGAQFMADYRKIEHTNNFPQGITLRTPPTFLSTPIETSMVLTQLQNRSSAEQPRLDNLRKPTKDDVTVVLPVLNEEDAISLVIDELHENGYHNILVVDGHSTDLTVENARGKCVRVIEQHQEGKGGAIKTAIERVSTPYMLTMDGDSTYDAADIETFLDYANEYEQVIGTRSQKNISRVHRFFGCDAVFSAESIFVYPEREYFAEESQVCLI